MNYTEELGKLADHQSRMLKNVSIDEMLAMSQAILDAKRIYVAGWGRAGNNIKMLSMDCSQIGLHTHIVGDNSTPSIHEGDILVIGSGSGKTASMQLFAKQAKSHGAKVGLIVGAIGSPIEEMADLTVHIVDDTHTNMPMRSTRLCRRSATSSAQSAQRSWASPRRIWPTTTTTLNKPCAK